MTWLQIVGVLMFIAAVFMVLAHIASFVGWKETMKACAFAGGFTGLLVVSALLVTGTVS